MSAKKKPRVFGESWELPLLFSAPMAIATVQGIKNQTRRTRGLDEINENPDRYRFEGFRLNVGHLQALFWDSERQGCIVVDSPYGRHGDKLWVRENFKVVGFDRGRGGWSGEPDDFVEGGATLEYCADEKQIGYTLEELKWEKQASRFHGKKGTIPNIFLPRWASRILLEIVEIGMERLSSITEADAKAEGAMFHDGGGVGHSGWRHDRNDGYVFSTARHSFFRLWQKINGEESLKKNPWTWVIKFKEVK